MTEIESFANLIASMARGALKAEIHSAVKECIGVIQSNISNAKISPSKPSSGLAIGHGEPLTYGKPLIPVGVVGRWIVSENIASDNRAVMSLEYRIVQGVQDPNAIELASQQLDRAILASYGKIEQIQQNLLNKLAEALSG